MRTLYRLLLWSGLLLSGLFFPSCASKASFAPQAAQKIAAIPFLESEQTESIALHHTQVTFRASSRQCAIFLNGEYQGNTTLTIKELPPGVYHLRMEKTGFTSANYLIEVTDGRHEHYYAPLAEEMPDAQTAAEADAAYNVE